MRASRQVLRWTVLAAAVLVAAAMLPAPVFAQAKLEAQYTVTLAGLPIGKGSWTVEVSDGQYSASANGTTTGLMHAFTGGHGTTAARGTLQAGRVVSSIYASTISSRKKTDEIHLSIANGNVKEFKVQPPQDDDPERVAMTEAHRHGILDPMTASLMRVPGSGNMLSAEACPHSLAIFDGRLRYDLQLAFKRMDKVKANKGYSGPVVVCAVYFTPVAGHIPSRTAIKYIAKQRDIEVWLAPIAGTRVLVPFRAHGPSPVGQVVLEASDFVTVVTPSRAVATGTKTQ
ncbi:MAG: DUF3108 domain-containing protein [Pseudolabrys sp.]